MAIGFKQLANVNQNTQTNPVTCMIWILVLI